MPTLSLLPSAAKAECADTASSSATGKSRAAPRSNRLRVVLISLAPFDPFELDGSVVGNDFLPPFGDQGIGLRDRRHGGARVLVDPYLRAVGVGRALVHMREHEQIGAGLARHRAAVAVVGGVAVGVAGGRERRDALPLDLAGLLPGDVLRERRQVVLRVELVDGRPELVLLAGLRKLDPAAVDPPELLARGDQRVVDRLVGGIQVVERADLPTEE